MRNLQVGDDEATEILAKLVPRITYKDWSLNLREIDRGQGCEGLTLVIEATVPDTCDLGNMVTFAHLFPVLPAAYTEPSWLRWILDCLLYVEMHEALEWFRLDGEQTYFPGHAPGTNPYTVTPIGEKTKAQAFEAAVPWYGLPVSDPHFAHQRVKVE